jgi:hypothetical protein
VALEDRALLSFVAPVNYPTDAGPRSAVVGDFNGDGIPDVAVVNAYSNTVKVFLGNGHGAFHAGGSMTIGRNPLSAAVGDFNGDGELDMVVADDYAGGPIQLLKGNGDGTFQAPVNVFSSLSFTPLSLAVGALTASGNLDVVITGRVSSSTGSFGEVVILPGRGDGTFGTPYLVRVGTFPNSVVLGDFNHDGMLDAAVTDSASGRVDVLLGNGHGTFKAPVSYATGAPAGMTIADYYLATGDFNGDGNLDIVSANRGNSTVSVLLGKGDGTFQSAVTYLVGGRGPQSVAVGDFNHDGKLDIVVANVDDYTICVLLGKGDGTFAAPVIDYTGTGPNSLAVADFNGDHLPDLAVTNSSSNTLSILINDGVWNTAAAPVNYPTDAGPRSAVVGDFNGDGISDVAVVNAYSNTVKVFLGKGDGTFQAGGSMAIGSNPLSAAVGDFNRDGKLDMVVADDYAGGPIQFLKGNGDGTFQAPINVFSSPLFTPLSLAVGALTTSGNLDVVITGQVSSSTGSFGKVVILPGRGNGTFRTPHGLRVGTFPNSVVLGDFNHDGALDAVVTDAAAGTVDMLLGNGNGTFKAPVSYATGAPADTTIADYYLATGDFNGDGNLDIVSANRGNNTVSVLLANGDGTFQSAVTYLVGGRGPQSVAVGDFNHDGKLDIVVANVDDYTICVLPGKGDGTFASPVIDYTGIGPNSLAVADFNGDHLPDLAVTNSSSNTLTILINNQSWNAPSGPAASVSGQWGPAEGYTGPTMNFPGIWQQSQSGLIPSMSEAPSARPAKASIARHPLGTAHPSPVTAIDGMFAAEQRDDSVADNWALESWFGALI